MKEDYNIQETIDNYLNGLMSEKEKTAFEETIAKNGDLASLVEEAKLINEAIYFASLSTLKEKVGKDIKNIKYKSKPSTGKYLLGAALIVGATTGTYLIANQTTKSSQTTPATIDKSVNTNDVITTKSVVLKDSAIENNSNTSEVKVAQPTESTTNKPIDRTPNTTLPKKPETEKLSVAPDRQTPKTEKIKLDTTNKEVMPPKTVKATVPEEQPTTPVCMKDYHVKTDASCKQKDNGVITIKSTKPLQVELDGIESSAGGVFRDVAAGRHKVVVTYHPTCSFKEEVVVSEKWCPLNSSFSFNPDYGEKWELLYEDGSEGVFIIFNTFGKEIYRDNFGVGEKYWDGSDYQGVTVPIGTYLATINYSDGRKEKVELTIVR